MPEAGDYKVEYSASDRSTCQISKKKIPKGNLRIGEYVQSPKFDGTYPIWYEFKTFKKTQKMVDKFKKNMQNNKKLIGLDKLRLKDQEMINELIGIEKLEEKENLTDEEKLQLALKNENQKLWEFKDLLSKNCALSDLRDMLDVNQQNSKGGEAVLLERCAYGMMFGALPGCPKEDCENNFLEFSYSLGKYKCCGSNQWGKCTWTGEINDVEVFDWVIPDDWEFLSNFKFVKNKKVAYTSEEKLKNVEIQIEEKTGSLAGITLCIAGKLSKNQKDFQKVIEKHGGEFITIMNATCDYLISTKTELNKSTLNPKIEMAMQENIPIVNEDFIHDSVKVENKLEDLEKYYLFKPDKKRKHDEMTTDKLEDSTQKKTKRTYKIKGKAAVDPDCENGDDLHVLEIKDDVYSTNLNMTDITRGSNSYYILQVLAHDNEKRREYYLFRKWGRLGTNVGSFKLEEYDDKDSAIYYFEKLFYEKTGNNWEERNNFVKRPSKFYPVEVSYGEDDDELSKLVELQMKNEYKGKLDPRVIDVIKLFFDTEQMSKTLAEMEIDVNKMPLGKLSKKTISEGFETLSQIEKVLKQKDPQKDDLLSLSNKFYTIIPHVFTEKKIPIIDSEDLLKSKTEMLESLRDMETATSLLKSNSEMKQTEHIHDKNYERLKTKILPIEKDDKEYKMVKDYVKNTHGKTHNDYTLEIEHVYKIEREGEDEKYDPWKKNKNRQLLWHGSRTTNFCGILSQGLRIAPPEAPVTGYMFGKGIYFADMVSKSANYCRTSPSSPEGVMILCDVALGDMYHLTNAEYMEKAPKGKLSTKGLGKYEPNPEKNIKLDDGLVVPNGKWIDTKRSTGLLYNEYIVYDVSQIQMKYMLKLKFNYNKNHYWQ